MKKCRRLALLAYDIDLSLIVDKIRTTNKRTNLLDRPGRKLLFFSFHVQLHHQALLLLGLRSSRIIMLVISLLFAGGLDACGVLVVVILGVDVSHS